MKLTKIISYVSIATIAIATAAGANQTSILGAYKGAGGYTLDFSSGGDYHSCDPQNRCLTISHTKSTRQGKTQIWKRAGYTYRVTPVGQRLQEGHYSMISVRVIDAKNRVISDRIFRSQ
jgi:hypothetical protein